MVETALLNELRTLVEATETALDLAVSLRDEAPRGMKAPYRKADRRLDKMANDLIKLIEDLSNA